MDALGKFAGRLWDHWLWLSGLLLMVEPLLDYHIESYNRWADRYVSRHIRTRAAWVLSISALFVACFLSFQDEFEEAQSADRARVSAEGQRDEARRQLTANPGSQEQQKVITDLQAQLKELHDAQTERPMMREEFEKIVAVFQPIANEIPELTVEAVSASPDAAGYAQKFMVAFHLAGLTVNGVKPDNTTDVLFPSPADVSSPQVRGLLIGIKNPISPPASAIRFRGLLISAGFNAVFAAWRGVAEDGYVFVVSYR